MSKTRESGGITYTKEDGMSSLGGSAVHPMDAKGRVSLPAKHRKVLPDDLVIIRSPDRDFPSLWIYSNEAYDRWAEAVIEDKGGYRANSLSSANLQRELYGKKESISCDQAGRILIPQELRAYASLERSVVIVGAGNRVEIWNPETLARCEESYREAIIFDIP
jgi:MraZ protein